MSETAQDWARKGLQVKNVGGVLTFVPIASVSESKKREAIFGPPISQDGVQSELERLFTSLWTHIAPGISLESEKHLVPGKLWRVDFYHDPSRVVIEIEGFRDHTSKKGFNRDAEKYLTLTFMGFTVVRLTRQLLTEESINKVISIIKSKIPAQGKRRKDRE